MAKKTVLLWWLTQADCEAIGERGLRSWPGYLRHQYNARHGRAGRGRLWVADEFGDVAVSPWPDTALARHVGALAGGIAIWRKDLTYLETLPGIVTDLNLKRYVVGG